MAALALIVLMLSTSLINLSESKDLQLGSMTNAQLVYVEDVKLSSILLTSRTKNVFYSDANATPRLIKAISAIDLNKSDAKVSVTAGGVGSTFVNIRMKSEKGDGLNYQVQIFV